MSRCKCDWSDKYTADTFKRITSITRKEEEQIEAMFRTYLVVEVKNRRTKNIFCTRCRESSDFIKPHNTAEPDYDPYNDFTDYYDLKHGDRTHCPFCGEPAEIVYAGKMGMRCEKMWQQVKVVVFHAEAGGWLSAQAIHAIRNYRGKAWQTQAKLWSKQQYLFRPGCALQQEQLDYKPSTAENLMRIYREFGSEQMDLLTGRTPAEVFGKLDQSQMVAMFLLEPAQRMELMDETEGIEDMSSRQIAELAKQKKAAEEEAVRERKARERADKIATEQADKASKLETEAQKRKQQIKDLEAELERVRSDLDAEKAQSSLVQPDTSEKDARIKELLAEIADLKQKNDPEKGMELIREQVRREMQKELDAANDRAAAAEKKLQAAKNATIQKVSFLFSEAQDLVKQVCVELDTLEEKEPDKADKLREVISQALYDMGNYAGGKSE